MTLFKKIILTIIFIASILLIQSYVFSESCTLTPSNASLRALSLGCEGDVCNFSLVKDSDVSSGYSSCASGCDDSAYQTNYSICMNSCYSENINPSQEIYLTESMSFNRNSVCSDKKINLSLASDVNFEMKETKTNLFIKGIDSLNTNGKNITVFVNNNDKLGDATFDLNINTLFVSGSSKIIMTTKERNSLSTGWDDYTRDGVIFKFNNIEILENSSLDLNIFIPKNIVDVNDNLDMAGSSLAGGEITFDGNSIINNGDLDLFLRAQDSQDGKNYIYQGVGFNEEDRKGGFSKQAGNIFFYLNNLENYGLLSSKIISGNGGVGGKGARPKNNRTAPGFGGNGGDAGHIYLFINNIKNDSDFYFDLISGVGGPGGDTGFDRGGSNADNADGGDAGSGGDFFFCKAFWIDNSFQCVSSEYNSLINYGSFNLSAITGTGNNGGEKINHPDSGTAGDGGDGGSFKTDLKINFIRNSGDFYLDLKSNYGGVKGNTSGGQDGVGGKTTNVLINFLENSSSNFNIFLDSKREIFLNESDVIINRLQNGSYLPSKIYTLFTDRDLVYDESCENTCLEGSLTSTCLYDCLEFEDLAPVTQNRKVQIGSSCYVAQPTSGLDYLTESVFIKSANQEVFENLLPENVVANLTGNSDCVVCDYYDFKNLNDIFPEDSSEKFHKKYTLYSTVQDTIPAGSLKFYYAKNNINFDKVNALYNPFTKQNNLPVYTNKNSIFPVLNEKLGLYEYLIDSSNLEWYYDPSLDLENKNLFCYNQNYRLEGSIGSKSFNFPFTPIFKK